MLAVPVEHVPRANRLVGATYTTGTLIMKRHPFSLTYLALIATIALCATPNASTATQPETQQQGQAGTPGQPAQPVQAEPPAPPADPTPTPTEGMEVITTESGLKYVDLKPGEGETPKSGAIVTVHYSGWLEDGTLFDSSVKRGTPATFGIKNQQNYRMNKYLM